MQIWLDTIDLEVISDAEKKGILAGVTTNPSILSKSTNVPKTINQILKIQKGPVAVQVTSQDSDSMVEEGRAIFAFSKRCTIKVPINNEGLKAIKQLHDENISVLGTAIFHSYQALLAATLGVSYIAPYFSHMGNDAYDTIKTIVTLLNSNQYKTQLLVASIKTLDELLFCSMLGVDAVTIKSELYHQFVDDHPNVQKVSQKFQSDWQSSFEKKSIKHLLSVNN